MIGPTPRGCFVSNPEASGLIRAFEAKSWGKGVDMSKTDSKAAPDRSEPAKALTPAARRALAEAEERRRANAHASEAPPREINGRGGPEPVRYGDWEVKGIASDF
jgi:hypothetical protein